MAVEFEIRPNPLTDPPSHAAQVRPKDTINLQTLVEIAAQTSAVPRTDAERFLSHLIEAVAEQLIAGNNVNLNGIGSLGLSIAAKIAQPETEVISPEGLNISIRPAPTLVKRVRTEAILVQVPRRNRQPSIESVQAIQGDLKLPQPGSLLKIEGENLNFNPKNIDEGVFLLKNGTEWRAEVYERGQHRLSFFVPGNFQASPGWTIEVRCRTRNTSTTSPLRVGSWSS